MERIASGDQKAFTIVFNRFRNKVYTVATMLTHDETVAEEMVQEVFTKVWCVRHQLVEVRDFEAWLFVVIRNAAYKTLQKMARAKTALQQAAATMTDFTTETDDTILFNNYRQVLLEAIDKLPPQQKKVWLLAREEGLKRSEIAAQMQLKPDTVKEYLALATNSIRLHCLRRLGIAAWLSAIWLMPK